VRFQVAGRRTDAGNRLERDANSRWISRYHSR
jgi:hypothetical protein